MKPYLCIEDKKGVIKGRKSVEAGTRSALYFIIEAGNWNEASENAKAMGGKAIRVLSKKERKSKMEDGSYDVDL